MNSIQEIAARKVYSREIEGIAAALLPYDRHGNIDFRSYEALLKHICQSGLTCAVNMDTGYVNLLNVTERQMVLDEAARILSGQPFVAGIFVEGQDGDLERLYCREAEKIAALGGTPIIFQSTRMHALTSDRKASLYAAIGKSVGKVYAFELGKMFAPNGEIWDAETFTRILAIPEILGAKHSSLDRMVELQRLAERDRLRPDFKLFTGNDLGIDMVEYGSDYLLGLASFCADKFALRDSYWRLGDPAYFELSDAIQYLGNCAFRPGVPSYKHSAACFLYTIGLIDSPEPHPACPRRPDWELELMRCCAQRLNYSVR